MIHQPEPHVLCFRRALPQWVMSLHSRSCKWGRTVYGMQQSILYAECTCEVVVQQLRTSFWKGERSHPLCYHPSLYIAIPK
jgi:hypothetical protein